MTAPQIPRRLRAALNHIATGIDRMILKMALEALSAAVAAAQGAAGRLIDKSQADATKAADLQSQVDNLEQDAMAAIKPLIDQLAAADPNPPAGV